MRIDTPIYIISGALCIAAVIWTGINSFQYGRFRYKADKLIEAIEKENAEMLSLEDIEKIIDAKIKPTVLPNSFNCCNAFIEMFHQKVLCEQDHKQACEKLEDEDAYCPSCSSPNYSASF